MSSKDIKTYKNKVQLNREAFLFLEKMGWLNNIESLIQNHRILLSLKATEDDQRFDEWTGFINSIKKFIKSRFDTSNLKMTDEIAKVMRTIKQVKDTLERQSISHSEELQKFEKRITNQSEALEKITS